MTTGSLYERLGGEEAVLAAVDLFYEKVLKDELTAPFFGDLDMQAQVKKQVAFMSRAFGGPAEQQGRSLRSAHAPLVARGLGDAHFNRIAELLAGTLRELGIGEPLVAEVLTIVGSTRNEVLNR